MANGPIQAEGEISNSVFQGDQPIREKLERARTELLDLSARNRLLNMPRSAKGARSIAIIDELSSEIFRLLAREARPFTFLAGKEDAEDRENNGQSEGFLTVMAQPEDDQRDERGVAARHSDTKLQTRLTPAGLQRRLLELYFDARTLEEEQGVNILFLALGALKWVDPQNAANIRYAPLILVPVALDRGNAAEKFKLRARQEEFSSNLSLEAFLDRAHGIKLPVFEADDQFDPVAYFSDVREAISSKPGWEVIPDEINLGFFSFAKFLMYRDLDPDTWPKGRSLLERDLVLGLLRDGFGGSEDMIPEDVKIDDHITPAEMMHIVDSDSSQALAVHEVRRGRNMVIQGPPGTGKSQTIANIIAAAVGDGKSVLFVAEKMAALEVVKRRLDTTGVGDACLELHSNKANKRSVLEELRRTWELGPPKRQDPGSLTARLTEARDALNAHADRMHNPHPVAGLTPFQVIGQLSRLKFDGFRPNDIRLEEPPSWTPDEFQERRDVIVELVEKVEAVGTPSEHPWRGVKLTTILPNDADRLFERIAEQAQRLEELQSEARCLASTLEMEEPDTQRSLDELAVHSARIAGAPAIGSDALAHECWEEVPAIRRLLDAGRRWTEIRASLDLVVLEHAWGRDLSGLLQVLTPLPGRMDTAALGLFAQIADLLPQLMSEAEGLARSVGRAPPSTFEEVEELMSISDRVASAPDADPEAFAAELWSTGVERAAELAKAATELEKAKVFIGEALTDSAWDLDLAQARATLAAHGTGFFRILSSEWREANRLVRSVLANPKSPLEETLGLLDALVKGRKAAAKLEASQDFGRQAFGSHWRDQDSASAPLLALVEWMRSLGGLGAEPRLIAARRPDRNDIRQRLDRTSVLAERISEHLKSGWSSFGAEIPEPMVAFTGPARCPLPLLFEFSAGISMAKAQLNELLSKPTGTVGEASGVFASVVEGQQARSALTAGEELGRRAFGFLWREDQSDWDRLDQATAWQIANPDLRHLASRIEFREAVARHAKELSVRVETLVSEVSHTIGALGLDGQGAFGEAHPKLVPLKAISARLSEWSASGEKLYEWVAYRDRAARGRELGCEQAVNRLEDGRLEPKVAVPAFEMAYFEALYADMVARDPELGRFDGHKHGRLAREFADMDLQRIAVASYEVVKKHHEAVPPRDGGAVGPLGVLRSEMARKRGHMPIRKLMERAAPAIQALKPVFMMSPLSVAQFLPPGVFDFDLLVMDEASQIQPVDALGAVARAKQVVVVGDPKQLPPTAFFSKLTSGSDEDDDDNGTGRVADIESILGLFTARGLPTRMLRWHYRSKHQSLIAVSNRQFYENKLFIVPSPYTREAGMGLRFHHIRDGLFDAGNTRTNQVEARVVARAIIEHAKTCPNLSLGVAAFSAAQRRAIVDQVELLRRDLPPEVEAFFQSHPAEPFFVKNLENVQGDERDVIFISVGYGPTTPGGRVPMRFGPLGTDGGERRLNVLISRAKQRCEVFASMTDEDIDPDFAQSRKGVFAFKTFLHFARTGNMAMAEATGRDHDSVFEEQVAKALRQRGYQVHRQVGIAGFFIDLAIADAEHPGRFIIGIECDGASYHDSRSARDRDRLRQSVLESHGWKITRVWSTDWFQRPTQEIERLVVAIETAKSQIADTATSDGSAPNHEHVIIEREAGPEVEQQGASSTGVIALPYVEAAPTVPEHLYCELHEAPSGALAGMAEEVVAVEGPIHVDEIVTRIRTAWGLKRAGARIQQAVSAALLAPVRAGRLQRDGDFLTMPGRIASVRDRSNVESATLRKPEMLPPEELERAILGVVAENFGATDEQIALAVSRMLGFKSTSSQLRSVIDAAVAAASAKQWLVRRDGLLVVGDEAPSVSSKTPGPTPMMQLIDEGEHERLEFKETLRWDVKQGTPNKKLEDIVVKTIAGFSNRSGGTLLIGVTDLGEVMGLERDYECLGGNRDRFELHLTNLIGNHFGQAARASRIRVTFPKHEDLEVCRVDVDAARSATFVSVADRNGVIAERFFVRAGNSTQELSPSETVQFIRDRFPSSKL